MDHGAFETNSLFRTTSHSAMDSDELSLQGYWRESTDGFNFFEPESSPCNFSYDPSKHVSFMGSGHLTINSQHLTYQEEFEVSLESPHLVYPEREERVVETTTSPIQYEGSAPESSELSPEFCELWGYLKQESKEEELFKETAVWDNYDLDQEQEQEFSEFGLLQQKAGHTVVGGLGDSSSPWSRLLNSRKTAKKRQTKAEKTVSLQVLQKHFAGSLKDAAKSIGVCPTTLKRICRQHGINRWPSRKIKKVNRSLKKLQLVVDSVMGAQGLIEIDSFYSAFPKLGHPNYSGHDLVSSFKITDYSKELISQPESLFSPKHTTNDLSGHALVVEDPVEAQKRMCRKAELCSLNQEELARAESHETIGQHQNLETIAPLLVSNSQSLQVGDAFRVKATFGDENVRFRLRPNWGLKELQREIAKRFDIDDFSSIGLKYLDSDHESILLTCDDDLEECKDLLRFSQSRTIKITLYLVSKPNLGNSFSRSRGL